MGGKEEGKPRSCTHAMGLGVHHLASECWKAQVAREDNIRREWRKAHGAEGADDLERTIADRYWAKQETLTETAKKMDPAIRDKLYDGVSKDGNGRAAYLRERQKEWPQKKSTGPLTSSQAIGWRCTELPPLRNPSLPNYGRKPVIKNGFYRKGGVAFTQRQSGGIPFSQPGAGS
eukprot:Hpha_TRINITY_DN10241_c0_g1::TRINITY_DN10241_c0_g1_i1::g.35158::m.35158